MFSGLKVNLVAGLLTPVIAVYQLCLKCHFFDFSLASSNLSNVNIRFSPLLLQIMRLRTGWNRTSADPRSSPPTPIYLTGMPSSEWIATAIPPFAVPSIFVKIIPVMSAHSENSLAWFNAFCPVVASSTTSVSRYASGYSFSRIRLIFLIPP